MNSNTLLLQTHCVTKQYEMGSSRLDVLRGVDLKVEAGEAVCIVGASGAGKSTLLHILGTLDRPSLGKVFFRGVEISKKTDVELAEMRNSKMGFVFQFHHLLGEFSALENVMMPCRIAGMSVAEARKQAELQLDRLGLSQRMNHHPSELSGGEQQRVAISRALVRGPEVLFADEPTGNLDTANGQKIQELFFDLKRQMNLTLVVVTHDQAFAARFPRVLHMRDGQWAPNQRP